MSAGSRTGRLMTMKAQPGRGDELAAAMLSVAAGLRDFPGCEVYLISQDRVDPDTIHIVEVWADEASARSALDAARTATAPVGIADVLAMLTEKPHRVDLVPLGGVGLGGAA
ncbi:putative quinol monooxygenase [Micromonospora coerulea]|uniref:putative quinol monooxygenase n=1 Tax=Micromonospora coerulea TaxID=47856 RepID=UPI00190570AC|nr:antibiotic biosynthesis monooxygenase family protein [Micromonospora veneta]